MPASEARIRANLENSKRSTGPRTQEGKERSRRNSLKHGMTGGGIVLVEEDEAEVARRIEEFEEDLQPRGRVARYLTRRAAVLSVRVERCEQQEAAALSEKARNAGVAFDDARMAEVEKLYDWIAASPATNARRLRQSPEGVDLLIRVFLELMLDLVHPTHHRWSYSHCQRVDNMMGRRPEDFPISRVGVFSKVLWDDLSYLEPGEAEGMTEADRRSWAAEGIAAIIEAEVEALRTLRDGFDSEAVDLDRAGAGTRALFDPSKEAILARRYEAAAERGFYRALREFREFQAAAVDSPRAEPARDDPGTRGSLASCFRSGSDPVGDDESAGSSLPAGRFSVNSGGLAGSGPAPIGRRGRSVPVSGP